MEDRHEGDYEILTALDKEDAVTDVKQAQHFVEEVRWWLQEGGWL